jgi:hypothetical protein
MTLKQEQTTLPERHWPKLSPEVRDGVIQATLEWQEKGFSQPKMEPSLLGLDWSLFTSRKFEEEPAPVNLWNPPEFISYAYSALDAYATAILAARTSYSSLGVLNFTCSLKRRNHESDLYLELVTTPERGRIDPDTLILDMLRSFPAVLSTKRFDASSVMFMEREGCVMEFSYPGRMVLHRSPFLRDRPTDIWPQVTLGLTPTDELRIRATHILAFLLSPTSIVDNPN